MPRNLTHKLISSHLVKGELPAPGQEIGLRIDQTLTQDATGTMVMLEFEALGLPRVKTLVSAQYVDHNLLQTDNKNPDDHLFLRSAARKYGCYFSPPGNGVSHPIHMERLGVPGQTLLGSDSHTCAAGSLGMLAIGAGGLDVAMAMAGEPFYTRMPIVVGIRLTGALPDWVSAKDVVLEMLRRRTVKGGVGKAFEYYGPGLDSLSAMDRHVIANMGAEMGATASVFPSDGAVRRFLEQQGRPDAYVDLLADPGCTYDEDDEIDLASLEPLIAKPSSPGNVVKVSEVAGLDVYQCMIGSSANPGLRDFAVVAAIVKDQVVAEGVSLDVNPTSRQILESLANQGQFADLVRAGARIHQPGCNGCIGMGQAPASGRISLRTVPRNFPGRSGTVEDQVYLCSPETAAASALTGKITDPRTLKMPAPKLDAHLTAQPTRLSPPLEDAAGEALVKGPNIKPLPDFGELPDSLEGPVLLKLGNDVSTDEILPAGARVLPFRSNIPAISKFLFTVVDPTFAERAAATKEPSFVVGGQNYGQGSSREHAAIGPRFLGVAAVVAVSFSRIHRQNLANFGILPLTFKEAGDFEKVSQGDRLRLAQLHSELEADELELENVTRKERYPVRHGLSPRQLLAIRAGGLINEFRKRTK
jgi:aconitate hydratase